jgi:adenine deaminase
LIPLVKRYGIRNCMLVTDDREPNHIFRDGHMNDVVRKAVALGCPPEDAIAMGTLQPARWHRLAEHGAVAPGYLADVLALADLHRFEPVKVWKRGRLIAENGRAPEVPHVVAPDWMRDSVKVGPVSAADLEVRASGPVRVIKVLPGELITRSEVVDLAGATGLVEADPARDVAKATVIERHKGTGRMGFGFVRGFGLRKGAIASTIAHDAHNLVVIGVNDADMAVAVNRLVGIGGGQIVVAEGRVLAEVACPIGGLLSDRPFEEVAAAVDAIEEAAGGLGVDLPHPFMAMSLLALSVLPELRITDRGLVDVERFELVPLEAP